MDLLNFYAVQLINRGAVVLFAGMVFLLGRHVVLEIKARGIRRERLFGMFSLLVLFLGELIKTGTIVRVRYLGDNGYPPDWIATHQDALLITGSALLFYGALHFIRVWSPEEWGNLPWMVAGAAAIVVALV